MTKNNNKNNTPDPFMELHTKLRASDPEIEKYVVALTAENLKLQLQISKLQAHNVTLNNRIKILDEENKHSVHQLFEALTPESNLLNCIPHDLPPDNRKTKKRG